MAGVTLIEVLMALAIIGILGLAGAKAFEVLQGQNRHHQTRTTALAQMDSLILNLKSNFRRRQLGPPTGTFDALSTDLVTGVGADNSPATLHNSLIIRRVSPTTPGVISRIHYKTVCITTPAKHSDLDLSSLMICNTGSSCGPGRVPVVEVTTWPDETNTSVSTTVRHPPVASKSDDPVAMVICARRDALYTELLADLRMVIRRQSKTTGSTTWMSMRQKVMISPD